MQLSDHSLRQIDEAYLKRLGDEALRSLSSKLLLDLKEARERLNQTSRNSSLPPGREAPWDRTRAADAGTERDEGTEETDAEDIPPETAADAGGEAEAAAGRCQVRCRIFSFDFEVNPALFDGWICPG